MTEEKIKKIWNDQLSPSLFLPNPRFLQPYQTRYIVRDRKIHQAMIINPMTIIYADSGISPSVCWKYMEVQMTKKGQQMTAYMLAQIQFTIQQIYTLFVRLDFQIYRKENSGGTKARKMDCPNFLYYMIWKYYTTSLDCRLSKTNFNMVQHLFQAGLSETFTIAMKQMKQVRMMLKIHCHFEVPVMMVMQTKQKREQYRMATRIMQSRKRVKLEISEQMRLQERSMISQLTQTKACACSLDLNSQGLSFLQETKEKGCQEMRSAFNLSLLARLFFLLECSNLFAC